MASKPTDSIDNLLRQHAILQTLGGHSASGGAVLRLPAVGDELFGFRLRHELGRGAFARVFLAEQAELAGRPWCSRSPASRGTSHRRWPSCSIRTSCRFTRSTKTRVPACAVCMPYFGGASLSAVLGRAWADSPVPSQGDELARALAAVGGPAPGSERAAAPQQDGVAASASVPAPDTVDATLPTSYCLLSSTTYPQAAAWLVARLAEGLAHAHLRGVLHRDIKPSNILLGSDGLPMLLDFNLAQQVNSEHARTTATLGGTVAYMSPEHLRALVARDPALASKVDERSDLYSLGMVLYEILTGRRPFDQSGSYTAMPAMIEAMAVELRDSRRPCDRAETFPGAWRASPQVSRPRSSCPLSASRAPGGRPGALPGRPPAEARSGIEPGRTAGKWGCRHPRLVTSGPLVAAATLLLSTGGAVLMGMNETLATTARPSFDHPGGPGNGPGTPEKRGLRSEHRAGALPGEQHQRLAGPTPTRTGALQTSAGDLRRAGTGRLARAYRLATTAAHGAAPPGGGRGANCW